MSMLYLYEVKPAEKKNVFTSTSYSMEDGRVFYMEETYRWGRATIESDVAPQESEDPYRDPFDLDDYTVIDQESDDGCSLDFSFEGEWTDEQKQEVFEAWEEDAWDGLDRIGASSDDYTMKFYGPLEIECVGESETPPEDNSTDSDAPKRSWPF
jgi:hypothetical protein